MNIYDEAIELRNRLSNDGTGTIYEEDYLLLDRILDELERAKKVEELLGLYRNLSMETDVFERSKYWEQINKIELEELE